MSAITTFMIRMLQRHYDALVRELFSRTDVESAAYLRCRIVSTARTTTLLVREVVPVRPEHYLTRERDRLSIVSDSFVPVVKRVRTKGEAFVLVHSHPHGPRQFSCQDDREEQRLFASVTRRAPDQTHGSVVMTSATEFVGRVWLPNGATESIARVYVLGERFRVLADAAAQPIPVFFDRQVRAFGPDIQNVLCRLHLGVVGAGGTGSPALEQLLRLGFGTISVFDDDMFDVTNANRVYNSRVADHGSAKVDIVERTAILSGLPTRVRTIFGSINRADVARKLLDCDVIFGCTDKELPRAILCRLANRYYIPVLDMGVVVRSLNQLIECVTGRVTLVMPGTACLMCRGRISPGQILAETLNPVERNRLAAEGYAPELEAPNPAVIPFTTATAAFAVNELLHRLTGFMGEHRSTETILQFDVPQIRTNSEPPEPWCDCADESTWGRGDEEPFLGLTWPDPVTPQCVAIPLKEVLT
jgi:proteasome lid subunit RPN8/RPN11